MQGSISDIINDLALGNQAVDVANFETALTFYNAVNARIASISINNAASPEVIEKLKTLRSEVNRHIAVVNELQRYAQVFNEKPRRPMTSDTVSESRASYAPPSRHPVQRVSVNVRPKPNRVASPNPRANPQPGARAVGVRPRPSVRVINDKRPTNSPTVQHSSVARPGDRRVGGARAIGGRPPAKAGHPGGRRVGSADPSGAKGRGGGRREQKHGHESDEGPGEFRCSPDEQAMAAVIEGTMIRPDQKDSLNVKMEDIVGSRDAKRAIEQAVCYPILAPKLLGLSVTPFRGVLMFGPPGTGKTLLAKAVAAQSDATMFICSSADLTSKFRGESEKLIKLLFAMARHYAPSVIFIDEVDALISNNAGGGDSGDASRRAVSEFQTQMEGVLTPQGDKPVVLIGATNYPWNIRPAMLRRFDKRVYVPLPTVEDVENILRKKMQRAVDDRSIADIDGIDFKALAARLDGYSGSDVDVICRNVCIKPMDRAVEMFGIGKITEMVDGDGMDRSALLEQVGKVTMDDFEVVIEGVEPSVDKALLKQYEDFNESKKSA
ncbi:katanin p60 ATPase-containing subunit A1 [Carpediemonas membranifera]|uniref:Katanin p60 ATPase-containing subunit A1 n=1 Tax=Carpediemonas membranifera TaxID=201153 RepID=A0A8J6DZQ9_9EUKA|nr:katanin p60 ATPase-containing subunit A1 [Carpediemonas membranifera]|eukprot:KAG9390761.1 katanin p60 ATPase-containing subunit A1 [Carpediemonas membranifera]